MKKRILFLCQYFYPETLSSAVLPYELASEFVNNGYEVSALVGYPNEYLKTKYKVPIKQNVDGIEIKRLRYTGVDRHSKFGRIANILSFSLAVFLHPIKIIKSDILICTTNPPLLPYVASLYAKFFHKKLIVIMYDMYPDAPIKLGYLKKQSKIAVIFNKLYEKVYKSCYKVVVLSTEMKDYLLNNKKISEEKVSIIPNWYMDCHQNLTYQYEFPLKILYGGNMGEAQEMRTLLEAIKLLKNDTRFKFIFVGQGNQKEKIKNYIEKNSLTNCEMHDFLEKKKYDKMIREVSITVLSLKKEMWGLGSPSKFYGYLAAKKPVIAIVPQDTDVAGDILKYNAGEYIPLGASERLAEFLKSCGDNPEQLQTMSQNAYQLFKEKYTLQESFKKYMRIVKE